MADDRKITRPLFEVATVFRKGYLAYTKFYRMTVHQLRVLKAIMHCRTIALGIHEDRCDHCGHLDCSYNSCRDRHCPKCQGASQLRWLKARMNDLLPVSYFHVVFTLPHSLNTLLMCNKHVLYDLFFEKTSETLLEFAKTPKHLGAVPGFIGVLHTWGQTLAYHVHLHFIVSGGGWHAEEQRWIEHKRHERFLYPTLAMSDVFRGKFISGLKRLYRQDLLEFPGELQIIEDEDSFEFFLNRVTTHRWKCYAKAPFSSPEEVLKYISRYTHRVAISNHRLLDVTDQFVTFRYKDYKDGAKIKPMQLSLVEFIRRFLRHVLPERFVRIRHYGFLAGNSKLTLLPMIRKSLEELLQGGKRILERALEKSQSLVDSWLIRCPVCQLGAMITIHRETAHFPLTMGFP